MEKPNLLYRFLPWESALKSFTNENLRIGRIESLNDPFELLPAFPEDFPNMVGWNAEYDLMRSVFQERYGLLCFAEEDLISKPEMWSHYADHHRGVALGFKLVEDQNNQMSVEHIPEPAKHLQQVHRVNPPEENLRVEITEIEKMIDYPERRVGLIQQFLDKGENGGLEDLLTRKGFGWRHEKEWRCVCSLDRDQYQYHNGNYFFSLNNLKISKIVLGWKNDADRTEIEKINEKWGAEIRKMKPTNKSFSLTFDELF